MQSARRLKNAKVTNMAAESRLRAEFLQAQSRTSELDWTIGLPDVVLDMYPGGLPRLGQYSEASKVPCVSDYWEHRGRAQYKLWQPSLDAFTALLHLAAGPAACVQMPPGVYMIGGVCTAAIAVPHFDSSGAAIDFSQLETAGARIRGHLQDQRARQALTQDWPLFTHGLPLPRTAKHILGQFLGVGRDIAAEVASTLEGLNLRVNDAEYEQAVQQHIQEMEDFQQMHGGDADYPQYPWGGTDNWSWYLSDDGYAPYARADVDFCVTGSSLEQCSRTAELLVQRLLPLLGDCAIVRTANTVTLCPDWPQRHVQVVLLAVPTLSAAFLFADLDCTTVAWDGQMAAGCQRSVRAIRRGANEVPEAMVARRSDTMKRVSKYVARGFSYVVPADLTELAVFAELERMTRHYMDMQQRFPAVVDEESSSSSSSSSSSAGVDDGDEDDGDGGDELHQPTLRLWPNTGYDEFKLPRGVGVTASFLRRFMQSRDAGGKLMEPSDQLVCTWKLDRAPEDWIFWGMASNSEAEAAAAAASSSGRK